MFKFQTKKRYSQFHFDSYFEFVFCSLFGFWLL